VEDDQDGRRAGTVGGFADPIYLLYDGGAGGDHVEVTLSDSSREDRFEDGVEDPCGEGPATVSGLLVGLDREAEEAKILGLHGLVAIVERGLQILDLLVLGGKAGLHGDDLLLEDVDALETVGEHRLHVVLGLLLDLQRGEDLVNLVVHGG